MIGRLSTTTLAAAKRRGVPITSGSLRKDGRVIIFWRAFPASHKSGYVLRSRLVWWLHTGDALRGDFRNIHHINGIRSDDRICNLEKLTRKQHSKHHHISIYAWPICKTCHDHFRIKSYRLNDPTRGQYCSQKCYQKRQRVSTKLELKCEYCGSLFKINRARIKTARFCSYSCSARGRHLKG